MTRVVIESPLAGDIPANQRYARRAVMDSLARGEAPYASHLFYHHPELLDDLLPDQRALGITAGLIWAAQADICAVYLDRGLSVGMRIGIRQARMLGQRISFRWLDGIDVWRMGEAAAEAYGNVGGFTWSFRARLPGPVGRGASGGLADAIPDTTADVSTQAELDASVDRLTPPRRSPWS